MFEYGILRDILHVRGELSSPNLCFRKKMLFAFLLVYFPIGIFCLPHTDPASSPDPSKAASNGRNENDREPKASTPDANALKKEHEVWVDKLPEAQRWIGYKLIGDWHSWGVKKETDLDTVVHLIKELACALTFRFAVETFNDRFNVDTQFSTTSVEKIINKLRAKTDERKTTLLHIIKVLAHASVLNEDEANKKVLNTWLSSLQDFVVDESVAESENKAELTTALLKLKYAHDEQEVLRVWREDGKNFWSSRITFRKVRLVSSTVSPTKGKTSTKVSYTVQSTVSSITVPLSELADQSTSTSEAQPLYTVQQEFNLLVKDDEVITDLSKLSGDLVERLIIDWKYSGTSEAVYTRNVVKILPQIAPSVSKQYLACSWLLFTHQYHKGLEPLIQFLSEKWENQAWTEKVDRFCSRFDLVFWRFPSNKRIHPKFTLPPNYKLKKSDYDAYLAEFGTADPDARIVGEALLIHFNVTYK